MKSKSSTLWTDDRKHIREDLYSIEKTLGFTYSKAIDLLNCYDHEAESAHSDISQLSHALRELINALPDYIGNGVKAPKPTQGEEQQATVRLMREIERSGLCDYNDEWGEEGILVPPEFATACFEYYHARITGHQNARIKDSMNVLGLVQVDDVSLTPWSKAREFFMNHTHLNRSFTAKPPAREEILTHLERIEKVLTSRMGRFFDAKRQLSFILGIANRRDDGGPYSVPSEQDVLDALSLINDRTLRGFFYTTLENPEWIVPLDQNKAFNQAAGLDERGEYWNESVYLRRVAAAKPEEVFEIITRLAPKLNHRSYQNAMQIVEELPVCFSSQLVTIICTWMKKPDALGSFWDTRVNTSIITNLLDDKETYQAGRRLANEYFMPRYQDAYCGPRSVADRYDYGQSFNEAWKHFNDVDKRRVPEQLLGQFFMLKNRSGSPTENTDWHIPSIDDAVLTQQDGASIESVLTQKLVTAIKEYGQNDLKRLKEALYYKKPIVRRCAIHAIYELIKEGAPCSGELVSLSQDVLVSDALLDSEFDTEILMLMKQVSCIADSEHLEVLGNRITSAVSHLTKLYSERLSLMIEDKDELANQAHKNALIWQHKRLSLLRDADLPENAKLLLNKLDDTFGKKEYQIKPVGTRTITGPNSPISLEYMQSMSSDDLLAHLGSWHPAKEDRWELISHEGQARTLKELIKTNPFVFADRLDELKGLRPIYIRHVIDGWSELNRNGKAVPIADFIELCVWVSNLNECETLEPEGDHGDDDNSYRNLIFASVSALKEALEQEDSDSKLEEYAGDILNALSNSLSSKEPNKEYEEKYGGNNMDPLALAINTIRPLAIAGLSRWAFQFSHHPSIGEALNLLLGVAPSVSQSKADAGAFGEAIPWIIQRNEPWAERHRSDFFGTDQPNEFQQIALSTILYYYHESSTVLEYLRPTIENAIKTGNLSCCVGLHSFTKDCAQSIGEWLYQGVALGHITDEDELLIQWEASVEEDLIWKAAGHICMGLSRSSNPASNVVEKVGLLWDRCFELHLTSNEAAEIAADSISCLSRSGLFPETWWGPRMKDVLSAGSGDCSLVLLKNELIHLSESNPELAFDIFEAHINKSAATGYDNYVQKKLAVPILARAKKLPNPDVVNRAYRCMDKLGSRGMIGLDEEVRDYCAK